MSKDLDELLTDSSEQVDMQIMSFIVHLIRGYYNLEKDYYCRKNRKTEQRWARQVAMYFVRNYTKHLSLQKIGAYFNRDHATVLHSIRVVKNEYETNKQAKQQIRELNNLIKFKSSAMANNENLRNNYYHIDMNNFHSMKLIGGKKVVILVGFDDEEKQHWNKSLAVVESKEHNDTGLYILEKKQNDEQRQDSEETKE